MPEMNSIGRFFVNAFTGRANQRRFRWLRANVPIPRTSVCLEVGCGNGDLAGRIVDGLGPARYVATDLDPRQIESARRHLARRYPGGIPSTLELREADMLALPFRDGAFDMALAYTALHHASHEHRDFTEVPRALREIDRVLRPGGTLVYEEFLHKEKIRDWLREQGYRFGAVASGWRRETVSATRPEDPPGEDENTS